MLLKRRAPAQQADQRDFLRAFEIPPVNLDLLGTEERDAAITATRELYDAIPGPFQILSVPIERSPSEHLDWLAPVPGAPRRYLTAYAGLYRDLAAHLARPPRRCLLVVSGATEASVARVGELVRRTAEEHGIRLRAVSADELGQAASLLAGEGTEHRVGPSVVDGDGVLTLCRAGSAMAGSDRARLDSTRARTGRRRRDLDASAAPVAGRGDELPDSEAPPGSCR